MGGEYFVKMVIPVPIDSVYCYSGLRSVKGRIYLFTTYIYFYFVYLKASKVRKFYDSFYVRREEEVSLLHCTAPVAFFSLVNYPWTY